MMPATTDTTATQNTSLNIPSSTTAAQAPGATNIFSSYQNTTNHNNQICEGGLKTSIKSANTQTTTFKGINIMSMENGKGLKFLDQAKIRKVKFDVWFLIFYFLLKFYSK